MTLVSWFEDVAKGDNVTVGGKGANLGELAGAGLPVPPGFVVTAEAYLRHDGCKARSDPGCFVRRRDDQAQHPWHPLARASQRGFSSPRCRSAPQLPHLFGR